MIKEFGQFVRQLASDTKEGQLAETLIMEWLGVWIPELLKNSMNPGIEEVAKEPLTAIAGKGLLVGFQKDPSKERGFFKYHDIINVIKGPYQLNLGTPGTVGLSGSMVGLSLGSSS